MHDCTIPEYLEESSYGHAIISCYEQDGKLWAGNGEYTTEVNFCPFCGCKLYDNEKDARKKFG